MTVALDRLDAQAPVATRVDELRLRRDRKRRVVAEVAAVESSGVDVSARGLVASVRGRVESAGLLGTPDGEAALALAQAMSLPVNQDGSKFASLYAKLTVALDRLDAQAPVATRVDELRLRRDRKRRA